MVRACSEVQRVLCIVGLAICIPALVSCLIMKNLKLGEGQSLGLEEDEGNFEQQTKTQDEVVKAWYC